MTLPSGGTGSRKNRMSPLCSNPGAILPVIVDTGLGGAAGVAGVAGVADAPGASGDGLGVPDGLPPRDADSADVGVAPAAAAFLAGLPELRPTVTTAPAVAAAISSHPTLKAAT